MLSELTDKKIVLPTLLATLTLMSACSRMQVVPEDESGGAIPPIVNTSPVILPPPGTVIVPPVVTQPAEFPTGVSAGNQQSHVVQPSEGLYGIARTYNLNFRDLAAWNNIPAPGYVIHPGQTLVLSPAGGMVAQPSIPNNMGSMPAVTHSTYHSVGRGDTLYSISRKYGQNYRDIASWNGISPPYSLSVGQQILISQSTSASPPSVIPSTPAAPATGTGYHTVQRGETLYGIARQYGLNFRDLAGLNGVNPPYNLNVGQRLRISASSPASNSIANSAAASHSVSRGDTLYSIARSYSQTVGDITLWNNLQPPYTLFVGQKLRIAPDTGMTAASVNRTLAVRNAQSGGQRIYHQVRAGESLADIAALYGQNTNELALWNGIAPPYPVYAGQTILVHPR